MESGRLLEVGDQQHAGDPEEDTGDHRRHDTDRGLLGSVPQQHEQRSDQHHAGRDRFGDQVARHLFLPRHHVRGGVRRAGDNTVEIGRLLTDRDRNRRVVLVVGAGDRVGPDHAVVRDRGAGRVKRCLVGAPVVDLRLGVLFRGTDGDVVPSDDPGDLRVGVVEITDLDRLGRTHDLTRRLEVHLDAVVAHVALVRRVGLGVDVQRVVRAGVHARLAPDAVVVLEVDDAVLGPIERRGRADLHARRVVALVASHHRELAGDVGERTGLDVFHPGAVHPEGDVVLAFAGDGAGVTADATVAVEEETQSCHPHSVGRHQVRR